MDFYGDDINYRIDAGYTSSDGMKTNVNIQELQGGEQFELDGVQISSLDVPHSIKTLAYKFEAGGQKVVLSGDTKYTEDLIEFSKDADLMVMDGMLAPVKEEDRIIQTFMFLKDNFASAHITLEEIGQTAAKANVKTLVLNHLTTGEIDEELTKKVLEEQGFTGKVIISETNAAYDVE